MDYIGQDDFYDILSDTSSTGFDEKLSPNICPILSDMYSLEQDFQFTEPPMMSLFEDSSLTYLCEICHKNVIKLEENPGGIRKKRKRTENQLIVASMKVCENCRKLDLDELKKLSGSAQCKRVVKREHAKRRTQENEAAPLKELQEKAIDEDADLGDSDKKKLKQVIRNRISAQQSRDRKKAYLKEIEQENKLLKQEANTLRHKIQQLHQENQYLKNQLVQIHSGSTRSGFGGFKVATIGIATLLSVFVLLNNMTETSIPTTVRNLSAQLDLSQYKNVEGTSLQKVSEEIIGELQKEIVLPESNSIVQYRQQRVDMINEKTFLRKLDPCEKKIESTAMTTLFCPSVQAYWDSETLTSELKHLQVIIPLESLPNIEHTLIETTGKNYMLEILCAVTDINVLPISSNL